MSVQRFERLLIRAANNYGELTGADAGDALLLRDAELVKEVATGLLVPRYKLTMLGWRMARKLQEQSATAAARDERVLRQAVERAQNESSDLG